MLTPLRRPRRDQKLTWLRTIPGFEVLSNAEIAELASTADRTIVLQGARLVTEGGRGLECFVIADGQAEVRRNDEAIAEIGPGTVVGELALLDATLRNADVYALTDLEVAVFDVRSFLRAMDGNAQFSGLVKRFAAEHRI
jgi:CRP/FNR family transcriptional regulator, cyclic AMP receptor protein